MKTGTNLPIPGLARSREEYKRLLEFQRKLLDGRTRLGKMFSERRIRESGERIQRVIDDHLVAVGAAVRTTS